MAELNEGEVLTEEGKPVNIIKTIVRLYKAKARPLLKRVSL